MNNLKIIKLKNSNTKLNILPDYGGKISNLSFDGFEVLRPIPTDNIELLKSYKGGNFALVPFSNRIKNSQFMFKNIVYKLNKNNNVAPHTIHGHGHLTKWDVVEQSINSVLISYRHENSKFGWPWAYDVKQEIILDDYTCSIGLTITNQSNSGMPFGFGFHPFFNFNDEIKLEFDADKEWLGFPENFPTKTQPIKDNFNMKNGKSLWKKEKTVSYEGFKGDVKIHWVSYNKSVILHADKIFNHLIVHVPEGGNYFCVEPASHPTDGFNLAYNKIENITNRNLKPGQSATGLIKIKLIQKNQL